jgi:hypothetical protein
MNWLLVAVSPDIITTQDSPEYVRIFLEVLLWHFEELVFHLRHAEIYVSPLELLPNNPQEKLRSPGNTDHPSQVWAGPFHP